MKIHGMVFLLVGLGVAVVSKMVGDRMILFVFVGILLAVFGIIKLFLEGRKKAPETHTTNGSHYVARHHRVTQQLPVQRCRYCGRILYPGRRSCQVCGSRQ